MATVESLLERLRELDEKATPGPWTPMMDEATMEVWIDMPDPTSAHGEICGASFDPPGNADAPLVAEVRNALPAVVALIEAAQTAYEGFADDDALFYANQKKLAAALAAFGSTQEAAA